MNFTNEQLTEAKAAKSAKELLALAKENGIELTEEEAAKYFAEFHKEGELSDDELDNVSGGCGESEEAPPVQPEPLFHAGERYRVLGSRVNGQVEYLNILSDGRWLATTYYYDISLELLGIENTVDEQGILDFIG